VAAALRKGKGWVWPLLRVLLRGGELVLGEAELISAGGGQAEVLQQYVKGKGKKGGPILQKKPVFRGPCGGSDQNRAEKKFGR